MPTLLVIGGTQKTNADKLPEHFQHLAAVAAKVNTEQNDVTLPIQYISPASVLPDIEDDARQVLFKSGTVENGKLYTCTPTEVMGYDLSNFKQFFYFTHPFLNDVHHVRPTPNNTVAVVSTGLDMVLEFTMEGEVVNEWNTSDIPTWERFSRDVDYRKVPTTKPHKVHPNCSFYYDSQIWATRFHQKDAICLTDNRDNLQVDVERPHDGFVVGDDIYFTTVDGHIVIVNPKSKSPTEIIDLNEIHGTKDPLGWCRSIHVVSKKEVYVGFSRIRTTKLRENIRWVARRVGLDGVRGSHFPTRVAVYNLEEKKLINEINLEPNNVNVIFSVHVL